MRTGATRRRELPAASPWSGRRRNESTATSREIEPGRLDRLPGSVDRQSCAALNKEQHLTQIVDGLLERGGIMILDCGFNRLI